MYKGTVAVSTYVQI